MTDRRTVRTRALLVTMVLVLSTLVPLVAFTGSVSAAENANVSLGETDQEANQVVQHNTSVGVDDSSSSETGNSLNKYVVNYDNSSGVNLSDVGIDDIVAVGIDSDSDGVIENSTADDLDSVTISDSGTKLTAEFGGSYSPEGSDRIVMRYTDVRNPDEGTYTVGIDIQDYEDPSTTNFTVNDTIGPTVTNFSLVADGQNVDLYLDSNEKLSALSASVSGDASTSLRLSDFDNVSSASGYTYHADNVVTGEDGDFTATFGEATDQAGNTAKNTGDDSDPDSVSVNTVPVDLVNVSADPARVDGGTTYDNQSVTVNVADFSQDGGTDTVTLEFGSLATVEGLSNTSSNATVNSSALIDGDDADTDVDTVKATLDTGDGGGTTDVSVTFDLNVSYPVVEGDKRVPLNASAVDSDDGDSDSNTSAEVVHVLDGTPPEITNFTLVRGDGGPQDVDLVFNASEPLSAADITLSNDVSGSPSIDDFTETDHGDYVHYQGDIVSGEDGTFNASLTSATDSTERNTASEDEFDSIVVDQTDPVIVNGSADPAVVNPGETVDNGTVTVDVDGFSKDGEADAVTLEFAESLTLNSLDGVSAANGTVNNSALKDGDGDGDTDAVTADVHSGDGGGTADVSVTFDLNLTYPNAEGQYREFNATATDSDGYTTRNDSVTSVRVRAVPPNVTNFTLVASGQDVDLTFNASEALGNIEVEVSDDRNATLTDDANDFTETKHGDHWTYEADVSDGEDGDYNATLTLAEDEASIPADETHNDTITVNTTVIEIVNGTADPATVDADTTYDNQTVTVEVTDFSRDGDTDRVTLLFNESLTVPDSGVVSATGADASNARLVDTGGNDSTDAVRVDLDSGDGGGTTDVNVTFDLNVTYPDAEGHIYAFDATATDSDGEYNESTNVTNVEVSTIPPNVTNFTLVASGQNVDLTFNASEELRNIEVQVSDDKNTTLTDDANDFSGEKHGDHWTYEADVSDGEDGDYNATLTGAEDMVGIPVENPEAHNDTITINTTVIEIVNGTADPATVSADTTYDNQTVTVEVTDFSRDGGTDRVTLLFNESLTVPDNGAVSATGADASNARLVDTGGDNSTDAVRVDLDSGDGGGTTDVNVTFDLNVTYPDAEGHTYAFDATATDSDGEYNESTNVTSVHVRDTVPDITNFTLLAGGTNGQDVDLRLNATKSLDDISVTLSDDTAGTLTRTDFTENESGGEYVYLANVSDGKDGVFNATLDRAADSDGDDGSEGESDTLRVNEVDVRVVDGTADPAMVSAETTYDNQTVTVDVADFSQDGATDTVELTVNDTLTVGDVGASAAANGSVGNVTLTDANDSDGVQTVSVDIDTGDGGGTTGVSVTFDLNASYPDAEGYTYAFDATATDSDGDSDTEAAVANVTVEDTVPDITNFTLLAGGTNGQDVDLRLNATKSLDDISVTLSDDATGTLTRADFNQSTTNGEYVYRTNVSEGTDGVFNATLDRAADSDGDDGSEGESDTLRVNAVGISVVDGTVDPKTVLPAETVTNGTVTVDVADVSLDGQTDTVDLAMPEGVTVESFNGAGTDNASVGNATLVDADGDLLAETARVDLAAGDGGGTTDVTVTYDLTLTYTEATEGETLPLNASAVDSDGDTDSEANVTAVEVGTVAPNVTNFTLVANGQDVDLTFDSDEALASVGVDLSDDASGSLSLGEFNRTATDEGYTYDADVSDGTDGDIGATLTAALDDVGVDGSEGESDTITVDTLAVEVVNGSVDPATVDPTAVANTTLTVTVADFSLDGDDDTVRVSAPANASIRSLAGVTVSNVTNLSATNTTVNGTVTNATLADGADADATNDSVEVTLDTGDGGGTADATLTLDLRLAYSDDEGERLPVDARAVDSGGSIDGDADVTSVLVRETTPGVSDLTLVRNDSAVAVGFNASEPLGSATVDLGGGVDRTLSLDDFAVRVHDRTGDDAEADVTYGAALNRTDARVEATLNTAADESGVAADRTLNATLATVDTGGGGGAVAPAPAPAPKPKPKPHPHPWLHVNTLHEGEDGQRYFVHHADAGTRVQLSLPETEAEREAGAGIRSLSVTPARDANFTVGATVASSSSHGSPSAPTAAYVTVTHNVSNENISAAGLTLTVSKDELDNRSPTGVDVLRYEGGEWTRVSDVAVVHESVEGYRYHVGLDRLSEFAVALDGGSAAVETNLSDPPAGSQNVSLPNATLNRSAPANATTNATGNHTGDAIAGNATANGTANAMANATANGTANATANVTLTPNGTMANGTANGTANATSGASTSTTGSLSWGALQLVVLLLGALVVARRRSG
jgi:hypothetical protein